MRIVDRYWDQVRVGGSTARDSVAFAGTGRPMLPGVLEFPKPDCDPFRDMLAHPVLVKYLNVMCGKGFRLDHGPMFIVSNKGTAGHTMHGNGEPHRPHVAYHHQNGMPWVGGVTVAWQLHDCKEGMGGFACVPSSHKSTFPTPKGVRTGDDDMGLIKQPVVVEAGDVIFFMDSARRTARPLGNWGPPAVDPVQIRWSHMCARRPIAGGVATGDLLGPRNRRGHDPRAIGPYVRPLFQPQRARALSGGWRRGHRANRRRRTGITYQFAPQPIGESHHGQQPLYCQRRR